MYRLCYTIITKGKGKSQTPERGKKMLKQGMTYEEIKAMVKENGWEVLEEKENEQYGDVWTELIIWQDDHAVFVQVDDEGIYEIQFVPARAL